MDAAEIVAVLDAGPLIHLDEIEALNLLSGFREVLLPEAVEAEARMHRPAIQFNSIPGLMSVRPSRHMTETLMEVAVQFGLHGGELAAISVLKERHGDCLLSDDTAARALAEAMGFQVHGTVGLVLRGWQRKQITKARAFDLLGALSERSSLHLKKAFLDTILRRLEN